MQKPNSYDDVKVGGGYIPPQTGGHKMVIKQVKETKNKNGGDMIVVLFDFAKNDNQPGYFTEEFKNDIRPEKKWPFAGTAYINCEYDGECTRKLKSFITAFEKSNDTTVVWGDKFEAQFKNKKIGGVFGGVENEYNGKVTMRNQLRWFCDIEKTDDATIPDPVYLKKDDQASAANTDDSWLDLDTNGDIPWGK